MRSKPNWDAIKVIGLAKAMRPTRLRRPSTICQRRDRAYRRACLENARRVARLPLSVTR